MSKYFLPVDSTTSNLEHLRGEDFEKLCHRLSQISDSAPANRNASIELCGNAATLDLRSCSTGTSVGVHDGSVNVEQWDLTGPVHLPISCERPREFQIDPTFFPSESIHVSTSKHSTQGIEGSKGERLKPSNQYLDNSTGLTLRDDYQWIRRLQGAEAWPLQSSIKSRFNLSYDCTVRSKDGHLDPSTEIVTRNEPWSPFLNLKVISDSQQCRTGTTFEKSGSADQLRNEEYFSNLLKTRRESLIDPEAQYETVYRTNFREPAQFLQEKTDTGHKTPAQTQHESARVNICITPDPLPFRESDPPELTRRRNCIDKLYHTVDLTPLSVQAEHGLYTVEEERIFRPCGGKDRHSKVRTSKGLRDRRVRLSVTTAIEFYDIQDRLGYEQPSKAIDWLMTHAKAAIDDLRGSHNPPAGSSATNSKSSLGFKSSTNDEIATYSATSHISADSSNSGSVPIGARDGSDELPGSQAFGNKEFSISLSSARTNKVSRSSFLQTKELQNSANLLRDDEQHLWAKPADKKNSNSSNTSDGSRDHDIETMALCSARSESRVNARRRARERTIEKHRELRNVSGNMFSSKSSPNLRFHLVCFNSLSDYESFDSPPLLSSQASALE